MRGVLPMVIAARDAGLKQVFVPAANAAEGAIVEGIAVDPAADTAGLLAHLNGEAALAPARPVEAGPVEDAPLPDFADVMGQAGARRAMEIAAAGSHNLLLIGPPGSGKSMLAKRLPSILPDMSPEEALEATKIHSIAGTLPGGTGLLRARPFRAPHHNISAPGLTGGGIGAPAWRGIPGPQRGAVSGRAARVQPDGHGEPAPAAGGRAGDHYPGGSDPQLSLQPDAGGGHEPLPLRIFLAIPAGNAPAPPPRPPATWPEYPARCSTGSICISRCRRCNSTNWRPASRGKVSAAIRERVNAARAVQQQRYAGTGIGSNARIPAGKLRTYCPLSGEAQGLLRAAFERLGLSARGYDRVLKVARTIADLDGGGDILPAHVAEAVQYRSLDRKYWENR